MKRNEPSLDWLTSTQIQEVNAQMWIKDHRRAIALNTDWELVCPADDLSVPELDEEDDQDQPSNKTGALCGKRDRLLDSHPESPFEDWQEFSFADGLPADSESEQPIDSARQEGPEGAETEAELKLEATPCGEPMPSSEEESSIEEAASIDASAFIHPSLPAPESDAADAHVHLRSHHIHTMLPDQNAHHPSSTLELQERIVSLPFYQKGKYANLQRTIQKNGPLARGEKMDVYPWDGLETVKAGQVPDHQTGFWLLHAFDAGDQTSWQLGLDGVLGAVYVFINNHFAGFAKSTSQSLAFDLSGLLEPGENTISLLVFPYASSSWLAYGLEQDLYGVGKVWLQPVDDQAYISSLEVRSEVDPNLEEARIWIECPQDEPVWMHVMLDDPMQERVLDFESRSPLLALDLVDVMLWSMECPHLYTLSIEFLDADGVPVRWFEKKIGLRLLEERQGIWMLNGRKLLLKGLYLSDFFFQDNPDWKEAFCLWKKEQVNAIYVRQTPKNGVLELADAYGIAIVTDADLHTGPFPGTRQGFERVWKKEAAWKLARQMELLMDHCSVLAIRRTRTVFPEDFDIELYRHWEGQSHLMVIPLAGLPHEAWFEFESLHHARILLAEHWDQTVLMSGNIRLEEWEALQESVNFGGFFLLDHYHPWTRAQWSLRVQDFYTPWRLSFEKRGIRVENRNQFVSAHGHLLSWIIWKDGHTPVVGSRELDVPPQQARRLYLREGWDLSRKVSATVEQIEPSAYAPAAFVETSREWDQWRPEESPVTTPLEVVYGEHCTTIKGADFNIRFDAEGLVSLQCHRQEMLAGRPEVVLFAPDQKRPADRIWLSAWHLAERPSIHRSFQNGQGGLIRYDYLLPTMPQTRCSVSYSIAPSGLLGVDIALKCSSELPDLPYFGWSLPLLDPAALRVQNDHHLLRLSRKTPDHLLNVEYAQAIWPGSRITLCQIDRPLQIWITPGSFAQMRMGSCSDHGPVWFSAAPDPIAYEASTVENDAYKRIQFSLLLDLRKAQY